MEIAFPKPHHKSRAPRRSKRNEFSKKVREQIYERDDGLCRQCGRPGEEIHHVRYRSHSGRGVFTNGLTLCHRCHQMVHDNPELAAAWQDTFRAIYGPNFHKDEWDV